MTPPEATDEQRRPRGRRTSATTLKHASRKERVAAIEALVGEGADNREIAHHLGLSPKTIAGYRRDPRGEDERKRRESYRGKCGRCGRPTHGSDGRAHGPRWCVACAPLARRRWSDEQLLEAIRDWATQTGALPTIYDWSPSHAPEGHPGAARYLDELGRWPNARSVARRFGSLAAAIERAGVTPGSRR
jgi:IS30 family transposase